MKTFTDETGREWTLSLNLDTVERIQAETNVSIYLLLQDECKPLAELFDNLPALAHVCYVACNAEAQGVDRRSFCQAMWGDALKRMISAFSEELELFFPDPRRREAVGKLFAAMWRCEEKGLTNLAKATKQLDPETMAENVLTTMLQKKSGSSSAGSASSGSRRAR